jgi:hypothetical protein
LSLTRTPGLIPHRSALLQRIVTVVVAHLGKPIENRAVGG